MNAFAAAITRLFYDPNIATEVGWSPGGVGSGVVVRAITRRADETSVFGDARLWSEATRLDVLVSEVPDPAPGDAITMDGEVFVIQGVPIRDRERLVWTLDLRPR